MTFCVGIQVREGIVALADTEIVRGSERVSKQKLALINHAGDSMFTMTSGLRSVRDKTLTYLSVYLEEHNEPVDRLFRVVNMFSNQLRQVRAEDGEALAAGGFTFNTHAIIGGCLSADQTPQLYYVYPEGNWIEVAHDSPYFIIGRTTYGKPILDRLLTFETPLKVAVGLALLAFDATRTSVTDVDAPVDINVIPAATRISTLRRYTNDEIANATGWWDNTLRSALGSLPMEWANDLFFSDNMQM